MANKGSILTTGQFLAVNDYLASDNGLFYAIMQEDGNFCVYRGTGPSANKGGSGLHETLRFFEKDREST